MTELKKLLKEKNIKSTKYRLAILKLLYDEQDHFFSIDQIHEKLKEVFHTIDFSTVYRTVERFEADDLIYKTKLEDKVYYSYQCADQRYHHHLICKSCGKKVKLDFCPFDAIESQYNQLGFQSYEHTRDFFGYCSTCKKP